MAEREERFKLVGAVHLFLIKDNQILLLRRANTGYRDGQYSVPAGHLNGGEKASVATAREGKEESGVEVNPDKLKIAHIMHRNSETERADYFFTTDAWEGNPEITEPDKCDDLSWFSLDQLPDNMIPYVKHAIECFRERIIYSEFGWIIPDEK